MAAPSGNAGEDLVVGGTGADHMFGGIGPDHMDARDNAPNDVVRGGRGLDDCQSDPGDSVFSCN